MKNKDGKNMHVYPHDISRWAVWVEGNRRPTRVLKTLGEAVGIAWDMALARGGNLFEHADGGIGMGGDNSENYARIFGQGGKKNLKCESI